MTHKIKFFRTPNNNANVPQPVEDSILEILAKDRPGKLTLEENKEEMSARGDNSLKIVVAGMESQNILKDLSSVVSKVIPGRQITFEIVGIERIQSNVDIIIKVKEQQEKWLLFGHSVKFKSHGVYFFDFKTERERQVTRWLELRAKEIEGIGVSARTIDMGLFIDGCEWAWNDLEGMLIKVDVKVNKFQTR